MTKYDYRKQPMKDKETEDFWDVYHYLEAMQKIKEVKND